MTNDTADQPSAEQLSMALSDYRAAAEHLATAHLARIRASNETRFMGIAETLRAGGFLRLQTGYSHGTVLDISLWLHEPLTGATELWNPDSDITDQNTRTTK